MQGKVTIVPYDKLLDHFLPPCPTKPPTFKNIFGGLVAPTTEKTMYDILPKLLNDAGVCPGFTFVANPHHPDQTDTTQQAVDCSMYPKKHTPQPETSSQSSYSRVNWSWMELPIECKSSSTEQDPFDDTQASGEPTSDKRQDAFGQILSYAELVFRYQHRMFLFMILFLGSDARIVRFDRSGIFVTEKFSCKTSGERILDFLWRYAHLSSVKRGHDPTVKRIDPTSNLGKRMKEWGNDARADDPHDYVRELFKRSLDEKWPWWQIEVHVQPDEEKGETSGVIRRYLVGKPNFHAPGVAGRGTRGYVALPIFANHRITKDAKFVYLKDAWRVDHDDIVQEGITLRQLNREEVQYVPTLVCHGDLPGQATQSPKHWRDYHGGAEKCALKQHVHYRLVIKEVGKSLEHFGDCSWTLAAALYCCLLAHCEAYENAKIIHRDISAGNILLYKHTDDNKWYGLLNDWELAKPIEPESTEGRQPDRTGTWQFMSAHALNNPHRRIVIPDELESFFHVVLYYAIRFLPHNLSAANVGHFLHDYFDAYSTYAEGFRCGRAKKHAMKHGMVDLSTYNGDEENTELRFLWPAPEPSSPSEPESSPAPSSPSPGQRGSTPSNRSSSPTSSERFGSELTPLPPSPPPAREEEPEHPLDGIVTTLLSWFKAYYALDNAAPPKPTNPTQKDMVVPDDRSEMMNKIRLARKKKENFTDPAPIAQASAPDTTEKQGPNSVDAEKLMTHAAILELFDESLSKGQWPWPRDRTEDKRPKNGYVPPKDQVAAGSTTTGSKKRSFEGGEASTSKRSRV